MLSRISRACVEPKERRRVCHRQKGVCTCLQITQISRTVNSDGSVAKSQLARCLNYYPGLGSVSWKFVICYCFFPSALPSSGRVEEEINKIFTNLHNQNPKSVDICLLLRTDSLNLMAQFVRKVVSVKMARKWPGRGRCGAQTGVSLDVWEWLAAARGAPHVAAVVVVERLGVELVGEDARPVEALDLWKNIRRWRSKLQENKVNFLIFLV